MRRISNYNIELITHYMYKPINNHFIGTFSNTVIKLAFGVEIK